MIDFSNNVNFFGPPPGFSEIILAQAKKFSEYPEHLQKTTRAQLSKIFNIALESIALSAGSTELLSIIPHFSKKSALIIKPSFWEYEFFYAKIHGEAQCKSFYLREEHKFAFDYVAFEESLNKQEIDMCYLTNPNNPTTTRIDNSLILAIIKRYPQVLFVIDETYLPFSTNYKENSLFSEAVHHKNICVTASLSKIYALPGIRLGFASAHPEIIEKLYQYLLPYGVSPFSLAIMPWIFTQHKYLQDTQIAYHERRAYFYNRLSSELGTSVFIIDSDTAFILIKIIPDLDEDITESLARMDLGVRGGEEFAGLGKQWLRVSIQDFKEMDLLIDGIKTILDKKSLKFCISSKTMSSDSEKNNDLAKQKSISNFYSLANPSNQQEKSSQKEEASVKYTV